ncbi:MAG: DUF5676 family membrane protein [Candidatus Babeliaceae bacterium]
MKHSHHQLALSAGLAASILYTILTILTVIWPDQALKLFAAVHFADFEQVAPFFKVTFSGFVISLLTFFVFAYALVWLTNCIHHCLLGKRK